MALPSVFGMALGLSLAVYVAWRSGAIPVYPLVLSVVGWLVFTFFSGDAWLPSWAAAWSRSAWPGPA